MLVLLTYFGCWHATTYYIEGLFCNLLLEWLSESPSFGYEIMGFQDTRESDWRGL